MKARTPTEIALAKAEDALFAANMARAPNRRALLKTVVQLRTVFGLEVNGLGLDGERPTLRPPALAAPLTTGPAPGDKVLSIRQPWAALILLGIKPAENRSWATRHRGRLWIHSAKTLDVCHWSEVFDVSMAGASLPDLSSLPLGCVVGAVDLWDCVEVDALPDDYDDAGFASGPFCWLLRNPQPLATPIRRRGALNLWAWR